MVSDQNVDFLCNKYLFIWISKSQDYGFSKVRIKLTWLISMLCLVIWSFKYQKPDLCAFINSVQQGLKKS